MIATKLRQMFNIQDWEEVCYKSKKFRMINLNSSMTWKDILITRLKVRLWAMDQSQAEIESSSVGKIPKEHEEA